MYESDIIVTLHIEPISTQRTSRHMLTDLRLICLYIGCAYTYVAK